MPSSNVLTQAVPTIEDHPLKKLMNLGVKTTINSDDRVLGITLMHEYHKAHHILGMSLKELKRCNH